MPLLRILRRPLALPLAGLLAVAAAPPLPADPAGPNFNITVWDKLNELPSRAVIAVTQTRDGYLWLGTLKGLTRFDGNSFTVFDEDEAPGLSSTPVVSLFGDSQGNLWAGTDSAGTRLVKEGRVRPLAEIGTRTHEGRLVAACEATNGEVWLVTANGQLCRYRAGHMDVWSRPDFDQARGIMIDQSGWLMLSTFNALIPLDPARIESGKNLPPGPSFLVRERIVSVLRSDSGGFWLIANDSSGGKPMPDTVRKFRLQDGGLVLEQDFGAAPWDQAQVFAACEDGHGGLVVGTQDRGITWFDAKGQPTRITAAQGLSHNTVLSLYRDAEGSLWVGTDGGGLDRIKRQTFDILPVTAQNAMQTVCEASDGALWFAANGGELRRLDHGQLTSFGTTQSGYTNLNFRTVYSDRSGTVWVGTIGGGLFRRAGDRLEPAPYWNSFALNIRAIHQDRNGMIWVGTDQGLAGWDGRAWQGYRAGGTNGLASNQVTALTDDPEGNLWIGTINGLNCLRDGRVSTLVRPEGAPNENITALLVDSTGALWIGTAGHGLARRFQGQWLQLTKRKGLESDNISYLGEDALGALWIGSAAGLIKVDRADLKEFSTGQARAIHCRTFQQSDGLLGECAADSQPAIWRSRDGVMWFATAKGLAFLNPAQLQRNTNPPPVIIESVTVDDELQNTNRLLARWPDRLIIPAGRERLQIRYTSLNFLPPEQTRFRYRLETVGQDARKDWNEAGDTRVANYPKLPPGEYRFRVIAANEDNVWSDPGAALEIVVEPPFWQTWWFLTGTTIVLLGAIVGTVHFISTQKLHRQLTLLRQQELVEKERARIARDLHDQLGANLTQVSLLGEMVETDKDLPDEVESHAKQISATARETATALDQIVWAANPSNDTLNSLITYACKYAQEYLQLAGLSYRIEAPEQLPATPVAPDVRHNVFLAFKESVNNVVKHAHATTAKVRVKLDPALFTIEIEDDGRGLPADAADRGRNGLRNMRKRMEDVGGTFAADPGPERGTIIRLSAPLGKNGGGNGN